AGHWRTAFRDGFDALFCAGIFQCSPKFKPARSSNGSQGLDSKQPGAIMSSHTEDRKQIDAQTLPSHDGGARKRPRKTWLWLAVALVLVATLLVSGIWSRVRARKNLNTETAQLALTAVSV